MIAGIAMFGAITASIAAYFVEQKADARGLDHQPPPLAAGTS
jgi:hypothetical protein